jgi:hypothetical protein
MKIKKGGVNSDPAFFSQSILKPYQGNSLIIRLEFQDYILSLS